MTKETQIQINGKYIIPLQIMGTEIQESAQDWRRIVATFIACTDVKESSQKLYTRTLSIFFKWAENTGRTLGNMNASDIKAYKEYLLGSGLSSLSVGSYIISVRKFYEWAESYKLYPNIAKGIKPPKRKQEYRKQHLTEENSKALLSYFEGISKRDYAIVNLMLYTGLRTIEVVRANIEDITMMGEKRVLKVWGKGQDDKADFVVLIEKAYQPVAEYLEQARKGAKGGEPLFTSTSHRNQGGRLDPKTISRICKDGLTAIGLKTKHTGREYSAHSLRHTTAVEILKRGGNMFDVQAVLRHSNPATSQIYTKSIEKELRLQNSPENLLNGAYE